MTCLAKWLQSRSLKRNRVFSQKLSCVLYNYVIFRKSIAEQNLAKSFPEKSSASLKHILKNSYQHFTYNIVHFFSLPLSYKSANIIVNNKNILDEALNQKQGIIMVAGHFGSWELLNAWLGYNNYPISGVIHAQKNLGSDLFFKEIRELSGFMHLYRKETIEKMYDVLKWGKILGLVSDQDAKESGVFINFLNHPASTPKGAAKFHLKTGAPILFLSCTEHLLNHYTINIEKVETRVNDTIMDITQRFSELLEIIIKKHPEQYFWWHQRWKTKKNMEQ